MVEMYCKLVYEKWAMANCFKKYVLVGFLLVFLSSASVDSDDGLNLDGEISPAFGQLKGLVSIDLRGNRLSGQIPDEIGDCSALESLDLSFNELYGDIPFSMSKLKQLENLILKNNKLIGPIPSTLSQIPNLKILDLAQNKLSGEIPRLLYWNEVLQYLGLRGNNLQGTLSPDMCQLTGLWYFDVRNNSLSGSIPDNIGNCTAFQVLSLQNNRFSGQIPSVIGLMQALAVLYLHGNKLTGPIPAELGNMTKLHYLNVANNHLEGPIPDNLSSCTNLNSLNLSSNNLQGPIPIELSRIGNLDTLDLSNNRLSGPIPQELGQLQNVFLLFIGNPGLCGYWLGSSCHQPRPAERVSISKAAILGIALGALVILLMILIAACRPTIQNQLWMGHLKNQACAIKKLYSHYPQCLKEFETELETVGSIKHRNLVSLQGYSLSQSGNLLFYDYMETAASGISFMLWNCSLELLTGRKPVDNESNLHHLILTKAGNNSVMDTVDPEISETCKDLGEVKKVFQLALLCTKKQPLDRPTMHEVVLGTLMPPPEAKTFAPILPAPLPSSKVQCYVDEYANLKTPHLVNCSSMSTSDAQLPQIGEVISQK
ncbi:LRR receptor-like serine/threonine-protein kinase ERECTA [Sesamum angolense]|uniref:LRR receptor-like serine/threonine-protein kinase ERECTA n=1 Tax=Sesamum angolense TaxID=2727404 RepID=A0AAE2BXD0_9LAMI|nr:LRR receptor-like serine/threonine-protein kinase ERECTA [Sesamum angolense]